MSAIVLMLARYDNRITCARANTTFALDGLFDAPHDSAMRDAAEILATLRERGVTQKQIADVLKIAQPNAATLYSPAKNGKLRKLSYDEGLALVSEFDLAEGAKPAEPINAALLIPIVREIAGHSAKDQGSELAMRPLARALSQYLRLVERLPSIHASEDELAALARDVISQAPSATNEA